MAKKNEEKTIGVDEDGLNIKEFIDSFSDALDMQEAYLKQVDWSKLESHKDKEAQYNLSIEIYDANLLNAETILTKSSNNPPKYADYVLKRIIKMVDTGLKRVKSYSDNSKKKKGVDMLSASFANELSFITRIGKDSAKIDKRLSKIKAKDAGVLDVRLKGNQSVGLASKSIMERRFPFILEFINNRKKNYLENNK